MKAREVFASAALAAQAIIEKKRRERKKIERKLEALDSEIARLQAVVELGGGKRKARKTNGRRKTKDAEATPRRLIEAPVPTEAAKAIGDVLRAAPEPFKVDAIHLAMRKNGKPTYTRNTVYRYLLRGSRTGIFRKIGEAFTINPAQA